MYYWETTVLSTWVLVNKEKYFHASAANQSLLFLFRFQPAPAFRKEQQEKKESAAERRKAAQAAAAQAAPGTAEAGGDQDAEMSGDAPGLDESEDDAQVLDEDDVDMATGENLGEEA